MLQADVQRDAVVDQHGFTCWQVLLLRTLPPVPRPLVSVLPICSLLVQGLAFSACRTARHKGWSVNYSRAQRR